MVWKSEWILAAKNKIGAWCYVDTLNKLGVLYNGYCLNNKAFQDILLADSIYQGFENNMQAKPDQIIDYDSLLMIERNANGNFYNLGYHSFWVGPEANSGNHKIISLDQSNGDIKLRSVNTGNGYFMRFLKQFSFSFQFSRYLRKILFLFSIFEIPKQDSLSLLEFSRF